MGRIKFQISNVDSIGNYLPLHPPDFISFAMGSNSLIINENDSQAFKEVGSYCCHVIMRISFDQKFENIQVRNGKVKQKNKHEIEISRPRRALFKGKNRFDVVVELE